MSNIYECDGETSTRFSVYAPTFSELLQKVADFAAGVEAGDSTANFELTSPYFNDGECEWHAVLSVVQSA